MRIALRHRPPITMTAFLYTVQIGDISLSLETQPTLFSPRRLDEGTKAMLQCVNVSADDKVLDLGCGCGVVGIYLARLIGADKVFLVDNDPEAVITSKRNALQNGVADLSVTLSDGFQQLTETGFTQILSNPPYHADFSVARQFILKGFNRLQVGGQMHFVTKRESWYRNKLKSVFGGSKCERVNGYYVMSATKRQDTYARRR